MDIHDPLVQLKITSAVCSFVAIATTVHRLFVRRGRIWADDLWAMFSMLVLLVQIAAVFMHVPNPSDLSKTNRVAAYYLMATSFYTIIWSARLSILFSIIRLDPSERRRRRLLYVAVLFFVVLVFLMAQLFWVCEPEHGWKEMQSPQCTLNKQVAICQLVTDVFADLILIIAPLKLLSGLEDAGLRHRLMVIFSTCIVTTIVSLVHAAYILTKGGVKVVIAALVEDCVSLVVCNIPVVVTSAIRVRKDTHRSKRNDNFMSTVLHFATRVLTQKDTTPTRALRDTENVTELSFAEIGTSGTRGTGTTMTHTFELRTQDDMGDKAADTGPFTIRVHDVDDILVRDGPSKKYGTDMAI